MRLIRKILCRLRVLVHARRNRGDLPRWLIRRPQLGMAIATHEFSLLVSNRLPTRLQDLATLRVAALVHCEFCLDIGSALALHDGLTERELEELNNPASTVFDDLDRLILQLADAMTASPAQVDDELREALLVRLSRAQYLELAATIAWENHRARLNRALGIRPVGFSDGSTCMVPATDAA